MFLLPHSDYVSTPSSPAFVRFQELARVAGLSRAFTLSVKLQLYTVLKDQREKQGIAAFECVCLSSEASSGVHAEHQQEPA
jgi:hypothetical protein